jgi:hypothetical protein
VSIIAINSGEALVAIVNKLHPGAIDTSRLTGNSRETINTAITAAEKYLGIPALLDANDFESREADETSVINYLSMLLSASHTSQKGKIYCTIY